MFALWLLSRGLLSRMGEFYYFPLVFLVLLHLFYLLTGVGVLASTRWGYRLFKFFLWVLFFGFPVGTIISYVTLSYMRKHQIQTFFGFAPEPDLEKRRHYGTAIAFAALAGLIALYLWVMLAF